MSKVAVMNKRGFTESRYRAFARDVGFKIDYNKKVRLMAKYYGVSMEHVRQAIEADFISDSKTIAQMIMEYSDLIGIIDTTVEGILAQEIAKTTEQSFCMNGDRNYLNKAIERNYISQEGESIDIQLDIINEAYNSEIEAVDFIAFITSYPHGPDDYISLNDLKKNEISSDFHELVGFWISDRFAITFKSEYGYPAKTVDKNLPF